MTQHADLYHATVTWNGEVVEKGVFNYDQLKNVVVRTAPKHSKINAFDLLNTAIARDSTFEIDNWRIRVLKIGH